MRKCFPLILSLLLMLCCLSLPAAAAAESEPGLLSASQDTSAETEAPADSDSAEDPAAFNPLPMYLGGLLGGALIGVLMVKGSNRGGRKL